MIENGNVIIIFKIDSENYRPHIDPQQISK